MVEGLMFSAYSESRIVSSADKVAEKLSPEHIAQII
jgi:hypothetical protein